ncbi:hypothetical protein J4E91_007123 [Alternaria rosae]|nr:hypothetical protein J4E91_007123 [Alternaria rosae]
MGTPLKDRDTFLDQGIDMYLTYNNTCPIHEDVVLFHLPREPQFVSGERNATTLDQITDDIEASKFVSKLFYITMDLYDSEQIFDSDIKEKINTTLKYIGERYNHVSGLFIKDEHMAGVMDVAREMVKTHFKTRSKAGGYKAYRSKEWLPKMDKAVGWKHPI